MALHEEKYHDGGTVHHTGALMGVSLASDLTQIHKKQIFGHYSFDVSSSQVRQFLGHFSFVFASSSSFSLV